MKGIKDINGKSLELGHIIAVRYVWNSYVGEVSFRGLIATGAFRFAFFSPHSIDGKAGAYQVLGHINPKHKDFNKEVFEWYKSETGDCPVKIRIYENSKQN